jgi:hypothetical protein
MQSSSSSSRHFYPVFYLSFNNAFQEGSSNAICDQSSQPSFFLFYVRYFSPAWFYVALLHFIDPVYKISVQDSDF